MSEIDVEALVKRIIDEEIDAMDGLAGGCVLIGAPVAAKRIADALETLSLPKGEVVRELAREERAHEQTIAERDAAEETLSQAYYLVTGLSPAWSNLFGHAEALEEIGDALTLLRKSVSATPEAPAASPRDGDGEYTPEQLAAGHMDFLDAKATAWMAEAGVQRMFNAIASVFEKWAPQEIMDRFREKLGDLGHQCFVESAYRTWTEISDQRRAATGERGDDVPYDQRRLDDLCICGDARRDHENTDGNCKLNGLGHGGAPDCFEFRFCRHSEKPLEDALCDACCEARNTYKAHDHGGPDPDEHWAKIIMRALPGRYLHALREHAQPPAATGGAPASVPAVSLHELIEVAEHVAERDMLPEGECTGEMLCGAPVCEALGCLRDKINRALAASSTPEPDQ